MDEPSKRFVYWTPRVLCIAFAAFVSIFATEVFSMPVDLAHKILALMMHLIPTAMILITLAIVWRREWIGAILFPLLAVLHMMTKWGSSMGRGMSSSRAPCLS